MPSTNGIIAGIGDFGISQLVDEANDAKDLAQQYAEDASNSLEALAGADFEGVYDITANTPALTGTPSPSLNNGKCYIISGSGAIGFSGSNFSSGQQMSTGDKLIKKGDQWTYLPLDVMAFYPAISQKYFLDTKPSVIAAGSVLTNPNSLTCHIAPAGTYTLSSGNVTLTGNINFFFWDFASGWTWQSFDVSVKTNGVTRGAITLEEDLQRFERTPFFSTGVRADIQQFLVDIQFSGLTLSESDVIHIFQISRNVAGNWFFSIGVNATSITGRICQYTTSTNPETIPDSKGNIYQIVTLTALNSSGVTATAVINWAAITAGVDNYFSNSTAWKQATFNKGFVLRRLLDETNKSLAIANSNITDNTNRLGVLEKSTLFVGKNINDSVNNFLLDIQFFGLSIASSDIVHVFNIARNAVSGSDRKWTFSIGVNALGTSGRICQFNALNITEPAADAKGNRIQTISLTALNSSGVTATATVNWSAITDATDNYWSSTIAWQQATFNNRAISKTILGKNITDLAITNANVTANANEIASVGNNNLVLNNAVNNKVKAFLLDIAFEGNFIKPTTGQVVHIYNLWRAYNGNQWVVDIAISGTRFVSFNSTTYTEPTADANGRIVDIISLSSFNSSGITAKMKVDWSALSLGERLFFTSTGSYAQGALSPNAYNQTIVVGTTNTKTDLPSITIPNRIYTVLEDVSDRNLISANARTLQDEARNYSLSLYVDKFLKAFPLNTDVRFDATGTDKFRLSSPRQNDNDVATDHVTPSQTSTKSVVINGGTNYNNKTVSIPHYSTRESTNPDFLTKALFFGDSTIEGLQKEIGVPVGFGCISWSVVHEQFKKCQIDYWLRNGVSISDIQNDTVSSTYKDKYRYIGIGTRTGIYTDNYSINYRGVTKSFSVNAEGRGGWNINSYLNKPTLMVRSQGTWDILGLGNGTGTDYTGSASQIELYDRTAFNANNILDTSAMRAWFLTNLSYTGATLADYKTRGQQLADSPVNPFYDDAKNVTVTDSLGQTWQVKYSITKYLSRYRTIDNSGVRLSNGDSSKGTLVTNTTDYDVTLPNFIIMQSCQNDGNVAHFGRLTKAMADAIRSEYSENSYGTVNIGISIIDGAGTYFPKLYPYVSDFCSVDEFQRQCHNDNLGRAITELSGIEDTNRTFVLSHTHIIPTAKSIIWRNGNSPEFDLTGDLQDSYNIASRTSIGIKAHINAIGNRPIGIHTYAWMKYVLGL